ncbi:MAG: 2-phosphosulfolactate phosphatase, partial [Synergistaceae bacterium]
MKYIFDVAFLPNEKLKEHDCRLVVDLLRASTQITTFFDIGGEVLLPVTEVDEALELREALGSDWKLMGERGGVIIPGFDFGNSPLELS